MASAIGSSTGPTDCASTALHKIHQGVSEPEFGLPKDLIYGKDHRYNYRERGLLSITIGTTEDDFMEKLGLFLDDGKKSVNDHI